MRLSKLKLAFAASAVFALCACSDSDRGATPPVGAAPGLTAEDQSNSERDLSLTQTIRAGITSNGAMSLQARNVKVITREGVVTLIGPVETQEEKTTIEALARDAGAARIDSQLEIERDDTSSQRE
jgi:hypothetical protein